MLVTNDGNFDPAVVANPLECLHYSGNYLRNTKKI